MKDRVFYTAITLIVLLASACGKDEPKCNCEVTRLYKEGNRTFTTTIEAPCSWDGKIDEDDEKYSYWICE